MPEETIVTLTREDVEALADALHPEQYLPAIRNLFPNFKFRRYLDRSGERTRWAITCRGYEPREHFYAKYLQGRCIECERFEPDPTKWRDY